MIIARIVCLLVAYLIGLIQTSYIYGRMNGIDIREHGSGNAGTTNALRVLGKKAGLIVFIGDFSKGIIVSVLARLIMGQIYPDEVYLFMAYAALGVVLGHNFPFYLHFKGGKGIAATAGAVLGLLDPLIIITCLSAFILVLVFTKYVSLGSISIVTIFAIEYIISAFCGRYSFDLGDSSSYMAMIESCIVVLFLSGMAVFRHRENIKRLIKHTERKINLHKTENE